MLVRNFACKQNFLKMRVFKMIFATNNQNKVNQIKKMAGDLNIVSLKEYGVNIEVEEDGKTFEENAIKKAVEINKITHEEVLADDSGLCID